MPRATVWIRNEDWKQWQAIDKKAEWLHNKLNQRDLKSLGFVKELNNTKGQVIHFDEWTPDDPKYEPMDD